MEGLDILKKARTPFRSRLSKKATHIRTLLQEEEIDHKEVKALMRTTEAIVESLQNLDSQIVQAMLNNGCEADDLDAEHDAIDRYQNDWNRLLGDVEETTPIPSSPSTKESSYLSAESGKRRSFKLPKIELRKFSGQLTDWMSWWSQFSKIHEDEELHESDKFAYLVQCMTPGSRAKELIDSYPQTTANYPKAIEALKERFGKEKLLTQVYVRELLQMVINNAKSTSKIPLSSMYDKLACHLRALESLKVSAEQMGKFLFPMVESSLPEDLLIAWQRSPQQLASEEETTKTELDYLMQFLKREVENESQRTLVQNSFTSQQQQPQNQDKQKKREAFGRKTQNEDIPTVAGLHVSEPKEKTCIFCAKQHESSNCGSAADMTLQEKDKKIQECRACFRCLKKGHHSKDCKGFVKCIRCGKDHQIIMCPSLKDQSQKAQEKKSVTTASNSAQIVMNCSKGVIFETLSVQIKGSNGVSQKARVFLDRGSARSFVKRSTAERLGCKKVGAEVFQKELLGGIITNPKNHRIFEVQLESRGGQASRRMLLTEQDPIICNIPPVPKGPWMKELRQKKIWISDLNSSSAEVDILLGADLIPSIMTRRSYRLQCGLHASETIFGWVLMGAVERESSSSKVMLCGMVSDISRFWELDVLGIRDPIEVKTEVQKEEEAKRSFAQNLGREEDGRYVVGLPWAEGKEELGSYRVVAEKRLENVTRSLKTKGQYGVYDNVFKAWEKEGIIEEVEDSKSNCLYLPHRPVFKESLTTPVRPVFDASCRVGDLPSLNDCLYTGPNMIEVIPSILMRFREKEIGVVSDIRKAFQMISVQDKDRDYQRFLWWDHQQRIKIFRHTRVVFGESCSPFLLAATISHHLDKVPEELKEFAQDLKQSLYVDNCATSVSNEGEYNILKNQATEILSWAQMDLRQWERTGDHEGGQTTSVLGLKWDKELDTISCSTPENPKALTKRSVLSQVHQIFDPIGFTCPATIIPKMILQETWNLKSGWDDELPEELKTKFEKWVRELPSVSQIQIPRQVKYSDDVQIHVFVDASKYAYAAVVYIRSVGEDGVIVQLVAAKNRVAPLKKPSPTIPRLELLSCLIGSRLLVGVIEGLKLKDPPVFCWTDSSTALAWIRRNENWGTFVGRRVKEIWKNSSVDHWRHVPGVDNPADLPSRGCSPTELKKSNWWEGPEWLKLGEEDWPTSEPIFNEDEIHQEMKKSVPINLTKEVAQFQEPRFSNYSKNVKVWGWVHRFVGNCQKKKGERLASHFLTLDELKIAELSLIKIIQDESIVEETEVIGGTPVKGGDDGIYRVVTRIQNKEESQAFKSPIFLPKDHPISHQLIHEVHIQYCHAGVQFVMGKIREKFWVPQARRTIKGIVKKCVTCKRYDANKIEVDPSALPEKRTAVGLPFETTGVDLAGPLYLKDGSKCWVVLFTCAVYRCVHFDIVTTISTADFLAALERFIHTEGRPHHIFSDNGTNFLGAANLMKALNWEEIERELGVKKIQWIFNPPTAAWWGGWWERLVRTTKDLLKRVLGKAKLTHDELRTSLAAAAHTINGRPLTTVTEDPEDLTSLTPDTFRRGLAMGGFQEMGKFQVKDQELRQRLKMLTSIREQFQVRFRKEYLAQLAMPLKNKKKVSPIKVKDLVLVGADNVKRVMWPLGRVLELIPGKDGVVRVARVKTEKGNLVRPLQRLYPLEVEREEVPPVTPKIKRQAEESKDDTDATQDDESNQASEELKVSRFGRKIKKPIFYQY